MALRRPLPGIRFEGRTPPLRDPFPRMDIAAFVGFAASGPINVPVPIDDARQFVMIFGPDVGVPGANGADHPAYGHLGATVRAFFNNGGRRCWVVRVARPPVGSQSRFAIPGLSLTTGASTLDPAFMKPRSDGSWSDALRVKTNLVGRPLKLRRFTLSAPPTVDVELAAARDILAGDLVRVTWADVGPALYLFIQTNESTTTPGVFRLTGNPSLWVQDNEAVTTAPPIPSPAVRVTAERLTFDLTVRAEGDSALWTLPQLGFAPEHPRYVGALPTDEALFRAAVEAGDAPSTDANWTDLWRDASLPRFPLAAAHEGVRYLPDTMTAASHDDQGVAPEVPLLAPIVRDGLSEFDTRLFLDDAVAASSMRDLINIADAVRYTGDATSRRPLTGVHAVLAIDEVTMVAVPDAGHHAWEEVAETAISSPLASSPLDHPEWWRFVDCRGPRPDPPPPPLSGFVDCHSSEPIAPPVLAVSGVLNGAYTFHWTAVDGAVVEIEEASFPDWRDAVTIVLSTDATLQLYDRPQGDHFYRARYIVGSRTSEWSTGVVVRVASGIASWYTTASYEDATLRAVQLALVRLCAAKADRVAILSLPLHYDEADAIAHVAALAAATEPAALSYAAVWHPWLIGRDVDAGELRTAPPDGAMAGVMAMRALSRGAWVAPANETLHRVVALDPGIPADARQSIQDAAINLIRQEPHGFVCLNADTLSADDDLRPLNVRRLLILLRRAALRTGYRFTFEPHGDRLRRAVKRGFEVMLEEMFTRGAFAGRRTSDAFRVSTSDSLNPPASVDAGRFLAEIRVAPSRPLSFLTVRLVQRGDSMLAQEVR